MRIWSARRMAIMSTVGSTFLAAAGTATERLIYAGMRATRSADRRFVASPGVVRRRRQVSASREPEAQRRHAYLKVIRPSICCGPTLHLSISCQSWQPASSLAEARSCGSATSNLGGIAAAERRIAKAEQEAKAARNQIVGSLVEALGWHRWPARGLHHGLRGVRGAWPPEIDRGPKPSTTISGEPATAGSAGIQLSAPVPADRRSSRSGGLFSARLWQRA